ncbi:hypothetical protein EDD15DRAFT_1680191 [Pisolithus albus]|nr:hypothetical protein EDD15DRAFT_1680191 [Pisolithus albus]
MDADSDIPENVRAWHPSVRRPTNPPSPSTYDPVIDPRFIFEIGITDTPPSTAKAARTGPIDADNAHSIFVVSPCCRYCRSIHQACSRSLPSCARCMRVGQECVPVMGPYDILPRAQTPSNGSGNRDPTRVPGQARSQGLNGQNRNDAKGKGNGDSSISPIYTSTKRPLLVNEDQETLRKRRKTSPELISTTEVPETERTPAPPVATSHPPTLQLTTSAQRPSDSSAVERHAPAPRLTPLPPASLYGPPTTRWSPVKPSSNESKSGKTQSFSPLSILNSRSPTKIPCPPRVWTTTLTHLLSLFPDLGKTQSGLTWGDCATPIMLLGKGKGVNDKDAWVDPVSLNLSMYVIFFPFVLSCSAARTP